MKDNINNKIQEMQFLEQNLQNILLQKQTFQLEGAEITNAIGELEKSKGDVFKIIGQLMLKSDKSKVKDELIDKQKIIELRLKSIDKQEKSVMENLEKLRDEIIEKQKEK